ncbi:MAG: hypothetical protein JST80_13440 [Bdellovibrionales bacterium]|nr:hypothetical protein [Bdellovibrionales bacterium]
MKHVFKMRMIALSAGLAGAAAFKPVVAQAQYPIRPVQGCAIPSLDGDKVPFPLKTANSKFELAENETYLLNGYVIKQDGKPYFKIDFVTQPWLATYNRTQFPIFPVDAEDPKMLSAGEGELVQMAVVVRRLSVSNGGREWNQNLKLDVITPAVSVNSNGSTGGYGKPF